MLGCNLSDPIEIGERPKTGRYSFVRWGGWIETLGGGIAARVANGTEVTAWLRTRAARYLDEADAALAKDAESTMDVLGYGTEPVIPANTIEAPLDSDR